MRTPDWKLGLLTGAAIAAAIVTWVPGLRVVDGDTVDHGWLRWRFVHYDTPETGSRASCPEEGALGLKAKARLTALVHQAGRDWKLVPVWTGHKDPYGRQLGRLLLAGRDTGDALIADGLARPYDGGTKLKWCSS